MLSVFDLKDSFFSTMVPRYLYSSTLWISLPFISSVAGFGSSRLLQKTISLVLVEFISRELSSHQAAMWDLSAWSVYYNNKFPLFKEFFSKFYHSKSLHTSVLPLRLANTGIKSDLMIPYPLGLRAWYKGEITRSWFLYAGILKVHCIVHATSLSTSLMKHTRQSMYM